MGLLINLPPEESENYEALMRKAGLCNIYLVAPTTPDDRIGLIVKRAAGFIYYISREGVTGMQAKVSEAIVVGSAIVNQIAEQGKSPELVKKVSAFVKSLGDAVKLI